MVVYFLQSFIYWLVLGGELVYYWWLGEEGVILILVGKYFVVYWVVILNVGLGGVYVSYYYRVNEQVQVGVEFEVNIRL